MRQGTASESVNDASIGARRRGPCSPPGAPPAWGPAPRLWLPPRGPSLRSPRLAVAPPVGTGKCREASGLSTEGRSLGCSFEAHPYRLTRVFLAVVVGVGLAAWGRMPSGGTGILPVQYNWVVGIGQAAWGRTPLERAVDRSGRRTRGAIAGDASSGSSPMGSYATFLTGRSGAQKRNARLAAARVNGTMIAPGAIFSFNRRVGPWTPDRGVSIAPGSYDGALVMDWGGGVCQTSTTLYNAALIAGLEIVERQHHTWAPRYAPIGRDAAVARQSIDLKLRNPYPWPVRIRTTGDGRSIAFEIIGQEPGPVARIEEETVSRIEPARVVVAGDDGPRRTIIPGRAGAQTRVYRTFARGPRAGEREIVSQDSYPAMNRVTSR